MSTDVSLVNMRGSALDYSSRKEPLHVIAIGGLALARGLTLEGLAVSYVLRNVGAGDTLLQLGRWFGYRPGHEALCRIHLTEDMISHFEFISESVEELRDDLVRMEKLKKSPQEFGLKVRESPTGIAITAANKMRTARPVRLAANFNEKHIQAYEFYDKAKINKKHLTVVANFHAQLMAHYSDSYQEEGGAFIWKNVNAAEIAELVRQFDLPQTEFIKMGGGESLLSNYIVDRAGWNGGESWTVAIPYASSVKGLHGSRIEFPLKTQGGSSLFCRQRFNGTLSSAGNLKATEKNVVADFPRKDLNWGENRDKIDLKIKLLKEQYTGEDIKNARAILNCREQPVMLVHLFQYALRDKAPIELPDEQPVATISLGFTETKFKPKERLYAATVRLIEQLNNTSQDEEDDDMVIDDD